MKTLKQLSNSYANTSVSWGTMKLDDVLDAILDFTAEAHPKAHQAISENFVGCYSRKEWTAIIKAGHRQDPEFVNHNVLVLYQRDLVRDPALFAELVINLARAEETLTYASMETIAPNYYFLIEWLNEEVWNIMDAIAPDGCYFGAHEGDGSDYGFWAFEEDDDTQD